MSLFRSSFNNPTGDPYDVRLGDAVERSTTSTGDVGLVGFPFDTASTTRPGCRLGPGKIRQHLYSMPVQGKTRVVDFGDIAVINGDHQESWARCEQGVATALKQCERVSVFGGDSTTSFCAFRAIRKSLEGPILYLLFDAHADVRREYVGLTSGRVVRWVKQLDPKARIVVAGVRAASNHPYLFTEASNLGVEVFTIEQLHDEHLVRTLSEMGQGRMVHMSLNMDVFDPAFAPGTNSPSPGGLYSREGLDLIKRLFLVLKPKIFDIVELDPLFDHSDCTGMLAARAASDFIWS